MAAWLGMLTMLPNSSTCIYAKGHPCPPVQPLMAVSCRRIALLVLMRRSRLRSGVSALKKAAKGSWPLATKLPAYGGGQHRGWQGGVGRDRPRVNLLRQGAMYGRISAQLISTRRLKSTA